MKTFKSPSGVEIRYDERKKDLILKSLYALKGELNQPNLWVGFECSFALHNLAHLLQIDGFKDESKKRRIIFDLLNKNRNISESNINEFLEKFSGEIEKIHFQQKFEFHVLYPLNISENIFPFMSKIEINKVSLEFFSWDKIQKDYQINLLIEENNKFTNESFQLDYLISNTTPVICRIYDQDTHSAFARVEQEVKIFRSVLNYYIDNVFQIRFGPSEPLAIIRQTGHYGVFSPEGKLFDQYVDYPRPLLNRNLILRSTSTSDITTLIKRLNKKKPISRALINSLKLYCSALDSTEYSLIFLYLWQCLESLTMLSSKRYQMSEVVERAQILLNSKDVVIKPFLDLCSERRNNYVHKGIYDSYSQSDAQLLKMIVKRCLIRFIKITEQYQTIEEVEQFYGISKFDQKTITSLYKVAKSLISEDL